VVATALNEFRAPTLDLHIDFSSATSMSDVSDAITIQGAQMAKASGVHFSFDLSLFEKAPEFTELSELAQELDVNIFDWILQGGEDHVFLATGHNLPGIEIGRVIEGSGISVARDGVEIEMAPVAWSHFGKAN
jgi:thiamine-monophosphate kinase